MVYDYYDKEQSDKLSSEFIIRLSMLSGLPIEYDIIYHVQEIMKKDPELLKEVPDLNQAYVLWDIICLVSTEHNPLQRKKFLNYGFIDSYTSKGKVYQINTSYGTFCFKPYISSIRRLCEELSRNVAVGNNRNLKSVKKKAQLFASMFNGQSRGLCHHYCLCFHGPCSTITTAFVPAECTSRMFLHSFIEMEYDDGAVSVFDASNNLVMPKDDYYRLVKPEIVSKIPSGVVQQDMSEVRQKGITSLTDKEYFMDREKVMSKVRSM